MGRSRWVRGLTRCALVIAIVAGIFGGLAQLTVATTACGQVPLDAGYASCGDLGLDAGCYSNETCPAADHCTLVGLDAGAPVTCCFPGARGTLPPFSPCTSLDDCPSAVCAYISDGMTTVCSPACTQPSDCAGTLLPVCVLFGADGGGTAVTGTVSLGAGAFCGLAAGADGK
jgi:hypothetical protein